MKPQTQAGSTSRMVFSRWWIVVLTGVLIYGFATLITVTCKAFRDKPPMPEQIVDTNGNLLFTKADIEAGQRLFLRYGLMDNGSIWGHGAYLGPDFSSLYLHDLALNYTTDYPEADTRATVAKENRYDASTGTLVFNDTEVRTLGEAPARWKDYFSEPTKNGGLKKDLITDAEELRQLSAYFAWTAWCCIATRPGTDVSTPTISPPSRCSPPAPREPPRCGAPRACCFCSSASAGVSTLSGATRRTIGPRRPSRCRR